VQKKKTSLAATEQRNPRSRGLDKMSTLGIVRLMNREDASVARAVHRQLPQIARAVDAIVAAIQQGGRLFYAGAGTSGRLAALDASELPPTFGVPPELVRAWLAGGMHALTRAVEGAEDREDLALAQLRYHAHLRREDVVVALSASGTTPYARSALEFANRTGCATILITCNRSTPLSKVAKITIAPDTGPEVVTGSTRLKAGTAQKMVLNMLSTTAMVRLGYVYDNWMINVAQNNQKLRRRAARILEEATGASVEKAEHALRQAGHDLRVALVMLRGRVSAAEAKRRLAKSSGNVRKALAGWKVGKSKG
jgi:N-acetylmuramic acid 6-phosphate etherase